MIRKAMDTYHREATSYLKTSLLPILFTSCWVGQAEAVQRGGVCALYNIRLFTLGTLIAFIKN